MVGPLVSYAVMMWIGISKYSVLGVKDTLDFPTHSCPSNLNLTTFVVSGVHNYSVNHGNQSLMVTGLSVAMTTAIPQVTQDRSVCNFNVLVVDEESWAFDIFIYLLILFLDVVVLSLYRTKAVQTNWISHVYYFLFTLDRSALHELYSLSYLWYSTLGLIIAVGVGLLATAVTGMWPRPDVWYITRRWCTFIWGIKLKGNK